MLLRGGEVLKVGAGSAAAGLAMMSWPEFVFPGQEAGEELVPFQNVPRARPKAWIGRRWTSG